jgi:acyl carrier protein
LHVFAVFDDETIVARDAAADIDTWDSLSHIDLIFALEQEFKVVFTVGETASSALGT